MRLGLSVLILVHGLIHLMGFAKAFGFAELSQLKREISRPAGVLWLLSALAFIAAGILFLAGRGAWFWLTAPAVVLSQALIVASWSDAKPGTLANLILLVPLSATALESRPGSYGNLYKTAVREGVARYRQVALVTEADLEPMPAPVQQYLRYAGAVGKPRILNVRAVYTGDFRSGLKSRWMPFRAEQYDFFDSPTRVFLMKASMFGLPAEGLHLFDNVGATMRIKLASLFQVVDARGPQMNQGETVTLFNDLCLMAPACLIDRQRIQWEAVGPLEARARFTHMGVTVSALLSFNTAGELIDFVSNDRFLSTDGKTYTSYPWSTPVRDYKDFGGRRVPSYGEAVWHTPEGALSYGRFTLVEIEYNLSTSK
jgi:hypothetical protein